MTINTTSPLRFAIIGGGIAGATVANALIGIPNLDIHVFESASEFSERGAAVGLAINAQRALAQIIPSAAELLDKAGAVLMHSTQRFLGSGPQAGTFICNTEGIPKQKVVHRASLLRELLAPLPHKILHANKQLRMIIQKKDAVELSFKDGTTENFHAVIGADGIFSTVRGYVLQGEAANYCAAKPAGFWDCRNLVPIEKAKSVLREDFYHQNKQYSWIGDGGFMMHDIVEGGKQVHCVISGVETRHSSDRKSRLSKEILTKLFDSWLNGPIARGMIELLCEQPTMECYSQWEHKSTPAYANGRCCIVGDAAHATSPWQGAGAGLAIEDAMVLE